MDESKYFAIRIPKPTRRRPQPSLATFLILSLMVGVILGIVGRRVNRRETSDMTIRVYRVASLAQNTQGPIDASGPTSAMTPLIVTDTTKIEGRGTAAFFEEGPKSPWPRRPHAVRVTTPNGQQLTTTAHVEWARKSSGDAMALLFPDLEVNQLPLGSTIDRIDEGMDRGSE